VARREPKRPAKPSPESKIVSVKVKICGVRTLAIVEAAAKAGADYVGLVFFPNSPRFVAVEDAAPLAEAARGKIGIVAVLVDPDDALIDAIAEVVRPDMLQLHGSEAPSRVAAIRARTGIPVMKAIAVWDKSDVAQADRYTGIADHILFDAKAAPGAVLPGGNGIPFDWQALEAYGSGFALSGGLNAKSVGEAIERTGPALVDVSSSVESAFGVKDARLIEEFIRAAKSAPPHRQAKAS
jgi:phosphoribosylanthranilate isomerase